MKYLGYAIELDTLPHLGIMDYSYEAIAYAPDDIFQDSPVIETKGLCKSKAIESARYLICQHLVNFYTSELDINEPTVLLRSDNGVFNVELLYVSNGDNESEVLGSVPNKASALLTAKWLCALLNCEYETMYDFDNSAG